MKKRACLLLTLLALVIIGFAMNVEAAEIIDRGYCGGEGDGTNLTWTLDSDGVLVIEGQGEMKDLSGPEFMEDDPHIFSDWWHKYFDDIDSVIVKYGVTKIGTDAFYHTSLKSIVLSESLVSMGNAAFGNCTSLTSIDLPDSLMSIGDSAFGNCTSLSVINLPQSLTSVESHTFEGCSSLRSIALPNSVTSIRQFAFADCDSLSSIYIPSGVVFIDDTAFSNTQIKSIYFGGTQEQWNAIKWMDDLNENGDYNAILHLVDYEKVNDFVSRLYRNFLKREPDEKGLDAWIDALVSGRATGSKVVSGFVLSSEYEANSLSNEEYITAFYRTILNREPDAEGLNAWIAVMENTCTNINKKILKGFINSDEFINLCKDMGIEPGGYGDEPIDPSVRIEAFVSRLYRLCLERTHDCEGLNNWVKALVRRTATGSSVVKGFFNSQEFLNRNLNDEQFVTILYRAILDREPDQAGRKSWIDALERGYTRNQVLDGFLKSMEFGDLCKQYGITR